MRNLVIGSEGFIGHYFSDYLEKSGEDVIRFDIKREVDEDARFCKFDFLNIDRVYFLAWDVGGAKYLYKEDSQVFQTEWNVDLLRNVLGQIGKSKTPFLFISSQMADCTDISYGVVKKLGEVWSSLIDGISVRVWNVYGSYEESTERSHVVSDFIHQGLSCETIHTITNGNEKRQFVYIDDVCDSFVKAMEYGEKGKIYDVSPHDWYSISELANIIGSLTDSKIVLGDKKGIDYPVINKDCVPGWKPKFNLQLGLRKTVERYEDKRK